MYRPSLGDPLIVVLLLRTDGGTYNIQNMFFNVAGIRLLNIAFNYIALRHSFRRTDVSVELRCLLNKTFAIE